MESVYVSHCVRRVCVCDFLVLKSLCFETNSHGLFADSEVSVFLTGDIRHRWDFRLSVALSLRPRYSTMYRPSAVP